MKLGEYHALYFIVYGFITSGIPNDMYEFERVSSTSATQCRNLKFCVDIRVWEKMHFFLGGGGGGMWNSKSSA